MEHPLLYQINTRCWLRDLSARHKRTVTLADVPGYTQDSSGDNTDVATDRHEAAGLSLRRPTSRTEE